MLLPVGLFARHMPRVRAGSFHLIDLVARKLARVPGRGRCCFVFTGRRTQSHARRATNRHMQGEAS
jgi:hypothetical protein